MPQSPSDLAELRAEVAALSAVVAALFATTLNQNSLGLPERLAFYADAIGRAQQIDPAQLAAVLSRITEQASAAEAYLRASLLQGSR